MFSNSPCPLNATIKISLNLVPRIHSLTWNPPTRRIFKSKKRTPGIGCFYRFANFPSPFRYAITFSPSSTVIMGFFALAFLRVCRSAVESFSSSSAIKISFGVCVKSPAIFCDGHWLKLARRMFRRASLCNRKGAKPLRYSILPIWALRLLPSGSSFFVSESQSTGRTTLATSLLNVWRQKFDESRNWPKMTKI